MKRVPLELGLHLNVNQLIKDRFVIPGEETQPSNYYWLDQDGDDQASARITSDLTDTSADPERCGTMRIQAKWIDQTVRLIGCPRHFGGVQWYFVCPVQNQYVSVLWSFPGRRHFVGRKSLGKDVAYLSQYHEPGARANYSSYKLCDRIAGPGASEKWEIPPKPKWMRWQTYERLAKRLKKYRSRAGVLPRAIFLNGEVV